MHTWVHGKWVNSCKVWMIEMKFNLSHTFSVVRISDLHILLITCCTPKSISDCVAHVSYKTGVHNDDDMNFVYEIWHFRMVSFDDKHPTIMKKITKNNEEEHTLAQNTLGILYCKWEIKNLKKNLSKDKSCYFLCAWCVPTRDIDHSYKRARIYVGHHLYFGIIDDEIKVENAFLWWFRELVLFQLVTVKYLN